MRLRLYHLIVPLIVLHWSCSNPKNQSGPAEEKAAEVITEEAAEDAQSEIAEPSSKELSTEDSTYLNALIEKLPQIARYATGNNYFVLASVLEHIGSRETEKVKSLLEGIVEYPRYVYVSQYDPGGGYIEFGPRDADVTYTKVYWNLKNGNKLVATEEVGCGPVCSSALSFQIDQDEMLSPIPFDEIIPNFDDASLIPEGYDGMDPLEFDWVLPAKGKDIQYCLDDKCLTFKWNEGTFVQQ